MNSRCSSYSARRKSKNLTCKDNKLLCAAAAKCSRDCTQHTRMLSPPVTILEIVLHSCSLYLITTCEYCDDKRRCSLHATDYAIQDSYRCEYLYALSKRNLLTLMLFLVPIGPTVVRHNQLSRPNYCRLNYCNLALPVVCGYDCSCDRRWFLLRLRSGIPLPAQLRVSTTRMKSNLFIGFY